MMLVTLYILYQYCKDMMGLRLLCHMVQVPWEDGLPQFSFVSYRLCSKVCCNWPLVSILIIVFHFSPPKSNKCNPTGVCLVYSQIVSSVLKVTASVLSVHIVTCQHIPDAKRNS